MDAYSAARAVAAGRATAIPKAKNGLVESIRCLHVARRSAVKARTQAVNQIRGLLVSGPALLRERPGDYDLTPFLSPFDVSKQTRMFDPGAYVGVDEIAAAL